MIGSSSQDIKLCETIEINSKDEISKNDNLPKWYSNPVGLPNREDFKVIYGSKIYDYAPPKKGEYDMNCSLSDIKHTKAANMMIQAMKNDMLKNFDGDENNQEFIFLYSIISTTPMQRLVQQSGDVTLYETLKNIVYIANNE